MEINLNSPLGSKPLNYPHWTKLHNNSLHVVTSEDTFINVGDVVFDYSIGSNGAVVSVELPKMKVVEVLETRPARGEHIICNAIFQLLKVERMPEPVTN